MRMICHIGKHLFTAHATTAGLIATLALAFAAVSGCSRDSSSESSSSSAVTSGDPLADAPQAWPRFLDWAEQRLTQPLAPVAPPVARTPPAPRRPVLRLWRMLKDAQVDCAWTASKADGGALVSLGPFRSDSPDANLRVTEYTDPQVGEAKVMVIHGFNVHFDQVGSIDIEIRAPYGRHFELRWLQGSRLRVPLPDNTSFWRFSIETDQLPISSRTLDQISVATDGVGEGVIEIRSLRFMPRRSVFPDPAGARRSRLARETRDVIYTHCPAEVKFANLRLPKQARLQVGLGALSFEPGARAGAGNSSGRGDVRFEIAVEADGRRSVVLRRGAIVEAGWADASVDLSPWAGQAVTLILRASSADPGAVALWGSPTIYEPYENPPCLVLYLVDTLGAKHMQLYGSERATTPNISRLAKSGVWFTRAFCDSPVTVASVPDILLSTPTERHGVFAASISVPDELTTLADVFRDAGYATALFSTNVNAGPRQKTDKGFESFVDRVGYQWGHADRTVPLKAVERWLKAHADRPKLLYIHTAEPHAPYAPPRGFAGRFDRDYRGSVNGSYGPRGFLAARSKRDVAHVRALYDEEVAYADARFGQFLAKLGELGLYGKTNIILIADHGEELMEHGHWGHGLSLCNEVLRIPLVIAGPAVTARGAIDTPAQLYDIMPTALAIAGLPTPYELAGESLLPLIQPGGGAPPKRLTDRVIVHSHHRYAGFGVVQYALMDGDRWKLAYRVPVVPPPGKPPTTEFALYDLAGGFYQQHNVIDAQRDVARRLIGELLTYRQAHRPYDFGHPAPEMVVDPEQIRELQALGYVGSDNEEKNESNSPP